MNRPSPNRGSTAPPDRLYIIDSIAPFFLPEYFDGYPVVNWSKVPFYRIDARDGISPETFERIVERFKVFIKRVAGLGFNAVSIDDLAHMVTLESYPPEFRDKISSYQVLYWRILETARQYGLAPFVTTDTGFACHGEIVSAKESIDRLLTACQRLFNRFHEVAGVIVRIGECDGNDVTGDIKSSLSIRTFSDARALVENLVALCESLDRTLVVRTWTVGAHSVGDLIWSRSSYRKIFSGIGGKNLIVSHKYGDTDFFRYLQLNPLIFEGEQKKIVEFQARREYEGFGEFPSFVGYDYEAYRNALVRFSNFAGILVWCQTGGWGRFNRLTFLPGSSLWNEINTAVTISLFKTPATAEEAAARYFRNCLDSINEKSMIRLLKLSDFVIKRLWYLPEFSMKSLYFRRTRIPPLLWVFWDTIIIHPALRRLIRLNVKNRDEAIREGYHLLGHISEMRQIARSQGLDTAVFDFQYDTFELLAMGREYFLGKGFIAIRCKIADKVAAYRTKYPHGFYIRCDFSRSPFEKRLYNLIARTAVREKPGYRMVDKALVNPGAHLFYSIMMRFRGRRADVFAEKRAMGIGSLLD